MEAEYFYYITYPPGATDKQKAEYILLAKSINHDPKQGGGAVPDGVVIHALPIGRCIAYDTSAKDMFGRS